MNFPFSVNWYPVKYALLYRLSVPDSADRLHLGDLSIKSFLSFAQLPGIPL